MRPMPNETIELATILVTDLVGSKRLANAVGPVRAQHQAEQWPLSIEI